MNIFEQILIMLDKNMPTPVSYGWFHIMFLIIVIGAIILIKFKYNQLNIKQIKQVLLAYAVICLTLEVYKQLNFSFNYDGVKTWWNYQWYAFPFQFCSVPMYVALIAAITKNKKIEYASFVFLATYGLIAGIACMLYPATVFVDTIGINIQTMFHHGSMVVIGCFLLINKQIKYNFKSLLAGASVFIICLIMALGIDIGTYYMGLNGGLEMFFISPYHTSSLPVFSIIYESVPYLIFLFIYVGVFTIGAYLILKISSLFNKKGNRK